MSSTERILSERKFRFSALEREQLEIDFSLSTDELLRRLVAEVRPHALVPVSGFQVGSAGVTSSGEVFLGVNLEFAGASFAQTVHSEQFLICLSRTHSAAPLTKMAVSAPPCGHCRQFAVEFDRQGELELLIGDQETVRLKELLPRAFTPEDLDISEPVYGSPLELSGDLSVEDAARRAARSAYVPYSRNKAGVALRDAEGRLFAGSALENAAYNPGLPPLQAAVISAFAAGCELNKVVEVVLAQGTGELIDYEFQTRALAAKLHCGKVEFRTVVR